MSWDYKYDDLLKRLKDKLPKKALKTERFEIPKIKGMVEGNKTIITNLKMISDYLSRDLDHLIKYLSRELATAGTIEGNRVIFTGKFRSTQLNAKIEKYVNEFVYCPECGKPDTKLVKEGKLTYIKCMACSAVRPVRTIK